MSQHTKDEVREAVDTLISLIGSSFISTIDDQAIKTVLAALVDAQKDSERMDWLEKKLHGTYLQLNHFKHRSQLFGSAAEQYDNAKPFYIGEYGPAGETLRAAIDAAAKTETK